MTEQDRLARLLELAEAAEVRRLAWRRRAPRIVALVLALAVAGGVTWGVVAQQEAQQKRECRQVLMQLGGDASDC
jgi:hypothetical protein